MNRKSVRRLTDEGSTHLKLVLVGESNVGKSSLVERYVNNQFKQYQESTIGAAFLRKDVKTPQGTVVRFEIWDTAGQERFRSLAPMYYRGAQAAIVVYDTTNYDTFVKAKDWVKELEKQIPGDVVIAIAGNKCDLTNLKLVSSKEAQNYAKENSILFFETSAKSGVSVQEMFMAIALKSEKLLVNEGQTQEVRRSKYSVSSVPVSQVDNNPEPVEQDKPCCQN